MALINRFCTIYYQSAVVSIALSCTVIELFNVENIVTLKS